MITLGELGNFPPFLLDVWKTLFFFCPSYYVGQRTIWPLVTSAELILLLVYLFSLPPSIRVRTSPLISVSLHVYFILLYYRLSTTWGWNHDCWQPLAFIFPAPSTRKRGLLKNLEKDSDWPVLDHVPTIPLAGVGRVLWISALSRTT